jgi:hypothetical protein
VGALLDEFPNGPLNAAETDCQTMSPADPPKDPALSTPPTHIDP